MSGAGGRPSMGPVSVPVAVQPVSEAPPTREDHKRTLALESFLEEHGHVSSGGGDGSDETITFHTRPIETVTSL